MQIVIVGAGLAGLSTALALTHSSKEHHIILLEAAPALAELGAGVQLSPIATRQFKAWGLEPQLLAASALPNAWNLRRGWDGAVLNRVPMNKFEEWYGAPYVVVHRADLHRILHEAVVARGVELRLNSRVQQYAVDDGWVKLENGEKLQGDLVVACDGINSAARTQLLESVGSTLHQDEELEATGWAAYRLMADVDDVRNDPLTKEIVAEHSCNCWADSKKSVMTYMVRDSGKLNLVLSHPDDKDTSGWTRDQYLSELQLYYQDLDPCARRLINLSTGPITNWPVQQVTKLPTWVSRSGKFVLIGDAAHAMAFYLSMGVALAIEDATALATALDLYTSNTSLGSMKKAIESFQKLRKPRAEKMRDASLHAGAMLHLSSGAEQVLRNKSAMNDAAITEARTGDKLLNWTSYGITDKDIRQECYGHDVVAEMRRQAREQGLPPAQG